MTVHGEAEEPDFVVGEARLARSQKAGLFLII